MLKPPALLTLLPLATALVLSGCLTLPELRQPALELPDAASSAPVQPLAISPDWWRIYADPDLEQRMAEALAHNDDLRLAAARIEEARAALAMTEGAARPVAGMDAGVSRRRSTEVGSFPVPAPINNTYQLGLQASYEMDLWGRYRQASQAARAELLGSELDRDVVRVSLAGAVVDAHYGLIALDAQLALARQTLENRDQALALQKLKLDAGEASEYEYRLAEAELASTRSTLARLARQRAAQANALALLLGRQPRQMSEETPSHTQARLPEAPPVPEGLPSDLLQRRPDLRQAEQGLAAADARIREARAALFPNVTLTANLGSESKALSDLFSGPATVWGLAAGLAQTLYNAGRTEAAIQGAAARREQALIQYEMAVKNAFRETLDALVALRQTRAQAQADRQQADALDQALALAKLRYDNGLASYLEVLDAQRGLFAARQNQIDTQRAHLAALAALHKALGGGWQDTSPGRASS